MLPVESEVTPKGEFSNATVAAMLSPIAKEPVLNSKQIKKYMKKINVVGLKN